MFKGFETELQLHEHRLMLASFKYKELYVSDEGFDITAYFAAASSFDYKYYCFLNSFSEIQDHDWLSKLYKYISQSDIGLVGATGSWLSHLDQVHFWGDITRVARDHFRLYKGKAFWKRLILAVVAVWNYCLWLMTFITFPNYHIRTNAFMISREIMNSLECPVIERKTDAYRFESGKNGMTKQIVRLRKKVLVVGKNGVGYEKKMWNKSNTFWQSEQENLLVADNQTRDYQFGDLERRVYLSRAAWRMDCNNQGYGANE